MICDIEGFAVIGALLKQTRAANRRVGNFQSDTEESHRSMISQRTDTRLTCL